MWFSRMAFNPLKEALLLCASAVLEVLAITTSSTGHDTTACHGRAQQIRAVLNTLRSAGVDCVLDVGTASDECDLGLHVKEYVPAKGQVCFVPESLMLQPFIAALWESEDSQRLAQHLWDVYEEHNVCASRTALAVRLINEGRRRCDCGVESDLLKRGTSCSIWPCLLPDRFTSALEFSPSLQQLLNGTSVRGPLQSLKVQLGYVTECLEKVNFFPSDNLPTDHEVAWGFHAMRTRASGSDKFHSQLNPVTVMFNYHPNMSIAHIFGGHTDVKEDARGNLQTIRGDIMPAKFDLNPGDEVFYKYGEYTNAELLALYGFVVPTSLARECHMPAIRIHVKLNRTWSWDSLGGGEEEADSSKLKLLWKELGCSSYEKFVLGHDGRLLLKHSEFFPPCSSLHWVWSTPASPEKSKAIQLLVRDGKASSRLRQWPPRLQDDDASVWQKMVVHQWALLAQICEDELHRLLEAAAGAGLQKHEADGPFDWSKHTMLQEERSTMLAVEQIVNDEAFVFSQCKEKAGLASMTVSQSAATTAKPLEL